MAGQVVVPRNLRSMFALVAQSGGELASGGACKAYRRGLRVLCGPCDDMASSY